MSPPWQWMRRVCLHAYYPLHSVRSGCAHWVYTLLYSIPTTHDAPASTQGALDVVVANAGVAAQFPLALTADGVEQTFQACAPLPAHACIASRPPVDPLQTLQADPPGLHTLSHTPQRCTARSPSRPPVHRRAYSTYSQHAPFQANYLGHFALVTKLLPLLETRRLSIRTHTHMHLLSAPPSSLYSTLICMC